MNEYASLKKQNNGTLAPLWTMLICLVISAALLLSRLLVYSPTAQIQRIPLTRSNGITRVTSSAPRASSVLMNPRLLAATPAFLAAPGFAAQDENTVWSGETQVEIFSIRYDNATGETTVHSRNDVKVLAPGVGSSYRFELENTGNVALEFTMEMDAWFSHEEYPIPVQVRVTDYREEYLLGSGTEMVDVLRLADVDESGTLAVGHVIPYTLEWEWPFEMDDAYDTMLGNLAMDQDITLTIAIRTTATYTPDDDSDGIPATGDHFQVGLYSVMMVASLGGILLLLLHRGKEETNEAP